MPVTSHIHGGGFFSLLVSCFVVVVVFILLFSKMADWGGKGRGLFCFFMGLCLYINDLKSYNFSTPGFEALHLS